MECRLCGQSVLWLDRFGCCRACSPLPFDSYSTVVPVEPETDASEAGVCEADALLVP